MWSSSHTYRTNHTKHARMVPNTLNVNIKCVAIRRWRWYILPESKLEKTYFFWQVWIHCATPFQIPLYKHISSNTLSCVWLSNGHHVISMGIKSSNTLLSSSTLFALAYASISLLVKVHYHWSRFGTLLSCQQSKNNHKSNIITTWKFN